MTALTQQLFRKVIDTTARLARRWTAGTALALCASGAMAAQTVTYFHNDVSGSPVMATDAAGVPLWKENYRPYGSKYNNAAGSNANAIGFAGRPYDASTGLSYMEARYYDPVIGRFMGVDPASVNPNNVHSLNRYAYANNNPYRFVDPDGHSPLDVVFLVWDLGKLGMAVYSGNPALIGEAAADVALSVVGVVSPIPGTGQVLKGVRAAEHAVEVVRTADKVVDATKVAERSAEATKAVKETGSYTNLHASGKTYSGKGSRERSQVSGRRVDKETGDTHIATEWRPAKDTRNAFKDESRRIDENGGVKSSTNYNKVESPGKKYRAQDGG